jgi:formylglycine-generating enzyme required for sulfatase activity
MTPPFLLFWPSGWRLVLVALLAWLPLATGAARAEEKRIALVIGISAYQNAPALANPVNDARAIGEALRRLKFDVSELYDVNYRGLASGIRDFGIRAASADVAVVYYAGHGVQVERENYLLPADAKLERERDLLYEAMPLERLLGEVSQASKIGIVLLDSCRNNPFIERVSRSMSVAGRTVSTLPGMARVDNVPRNTMVVMAAKADQIAEDGVQHSPFASALLAHFQIPGLELSLFFRSVRDTVLRATSNRQEPYVFSSLGADPFYFYPRPPNRPPVLAEIKPLEVKDVAGPTPLGIPQPTDPDQDPLTVRVIGLPRSGEVRVDGRVATVNSIYAAERFMTATYKPDGKSLGPAGTVDILVEDGRGGSVTGSLPVTVLSSHHPPVVDAPRTVRIFPVALGIAPPTSPDGDSLTVVVKGLPRGLVQNGSAVIRMGDRLRPQDLANLTFTPEPGFTGEAGSLRYAVDNGHGAVVESSIALDVTSPVQAADLVSQAELWDSIRSGGGAVERDAFLRLFPGSHFAAESRGRQDVAASPPKPAPAPVVAAPAPSVSAQAPASQSPDKLVAPAPERPAALALVQPPAAPEPTPPRVIAPPTHGLGEAGAKTFQDCPTCPVMVRVTGGAFTMGHGSHDAEAMPPHHVEVRSFAIGRAPVTVAEWKACMKAGSCNFMPRMRVADERTPVHNLSWDDTAQFIGWLSRISGHRYRLPSEAEWEYAARGGTTTRYWWGESVGVALANCADCGGTQNVHGPLPVDALKPNPYGLLDILGGVAQWTADCWFPNYHGAPSDGSARDAKGCAKRVLRGGGFRENRDQITVTARANYDSSVRYILNGFRVARDED